MAHYFYGQNTEKVADSNTGQLGTPRQNGAHNNSIEGGDSICDSPPTLFHKVKNKKSILALVVSNSKIYAGTEGGEGGEIIIWSLETYERLFTIAAHKGSILSLYISQDDKLLFSSAGDAIVNVWCTATLSRLYSIYSTYDVGDIFSVVYSVEMQTVYLGSQNTSIQWYDLSQKDSRPLPNLAAHPSQRNHRFFDSKGPGGICSSRPIGHQEPRAQEGIELEIDKEHIIQYAHYGYVYCMLLAKGLNDREVDGETLISGGGDGTIKLWRPDAKAEGAITEAETLENGDHSVLAMALDGTFLYSGRLGGDIDVWDLDTRQLIRRVKAHTTDVLTIAIGHGLIFSGAANGYAKKFNKRYDCINRWKAHDQLILASAVALYNERVIFVTGGNDDCVAVWDVSEVFKPADDASNISNEQPVGSLGKFISYRTVSSRSEYTGDCRRGASWLRNLFKRFGADAEMLNTDENMNPIVFARFKGRLSSQKPCKKILFYGHYDVIAADNDKHKWTSDPFKLHGTDGYLYGRGVSDNKGPVLAAIYAAADLVAERKLQSDIVFLIEGEEESGSRGFHNAVKRNKHLIGDIDWVLLANSYWLNDDFPCLTYGLRGVIHATISVESKSLDLHSGVDGSHLMDEALKDLIMLLADLAGPHGRVKIPGFYDPVLPITEGENQRYDAISNILLHHNPGLENAEKLTASLKARWREPSLTVHRFKTSGPANSTIIPRIASAALSMRLVPNQDTEQVERALIDYLRARFGLLQTSNKLTINVDHKAEPWLGDPNNKIFQTLEEAIMDVWVPIDSNQTNAVGAARSPMTQAPNVPTTLNHLQSMSSQPAESIEQLPGNVSRQTVDRSRQLPQKPLYIREGGSIPAIRFLEKEFNAPAAHLPCGQASDNAHLDNERLRMSNLYNSREIFKKVFKELPLK